MFGVIRVPDFALAAAMRWQEGLPPAVALVDPSAPRGGVLEANAEAARHRVRPGLTSAQALARCPGLRLLLRSPVQEEAAQALLLECAWRIAPGVESTAPGVVTLDLRSVSRAGAWRRVGEGVLDELRTQGLEACVGFGPSPDFAFLATRVGEPVRVVEDGGAFCAGLPIATLEPEPEAAAILHDWGIHTVADFLRLPPTQATERLGAEATRLRRRATGRTRRVLRVVEPPEVFAEAFDFEHGVETTEPLLFLLRRFLDSLTARVTALHRVITAMGLTLRLDDGSRYERPFAIPAPTTAVEVLFRTLDTHLETLRLPQQPVGVRLELTTAHPQTRQRDLFERGVRDPGGLGFTLARLQAIVGEAGVGTPQPAETHRPGAFTLVRFCDEAALAKGRPVPPAFGLPLRRLRPPPPVRVKLHEGRPAWLASPDWSGPVSRALGPYRYSGDWWDRSPWSLEEWDVELAPSPGGSTLLRLARRDGHWSVEGTYDVC